MKSNSLQYTLRNIPTEVDRLLRRKAKEAGRSFNSVAVEALARGAGAPAGPRRDLRDIRGSMSKREAEVLASEVARQRTIDAELWK